MSQPEIIQRAQLDPTSETPNKVVEVAPLSNVASTTVMHSVENPSKNSSVGAFSDDFSVFPSHTTHGAEKINLSKAHETKLKPCNGNEESHRDFPVLKNPHKVAGSEHTNLLSSHQEQLTIMARDQAVNASNTCAAALAIPENVPLNQILSNLTTRNSEKATHKLRETKIPKVGKRGKKNVTTEDNGGLSVHGNSVKSPMSRERKKSKYLSYPYIDPMDEKNERKDPMDEKNETKEVSNPKQEMDKAKMTNLASAELLTKLRLTAQSGSRKHSNQVKSFFLSFRTFAFLEKEDDSSQDFNECNLSTKGAKESSNSTIPIEKNDSDRITKPSSSRKQKLFVKVDRITEARDRSHWIKRQCMNALRKNKTPFMETPYTKQMNETVSAINDDANLVNVNSITTTTTTTSVEGSKLIGHGEENSNRVTFVQLLNNVHTAVPNQSPGVIIQEDKALAQSSSNSNFIAKQSDSEEDKVDSASYGKRCSLEQQIAPPGFNPNGVVAESNPIASPDSIPAGKKKEQKRKGRALNKPDDKTSDSAQNGNEIETLLPKGKGNPIKRRRKNPSESKVQNNSAAVLLNFKSGFTLPSIESILQAFSGYGIINKSETRFVNELTAQVVFILSASAKEACRSFQNNNTFGPMIESYHFQPISSPTPPAMNGIDQLPPPVTSLPPAMNEINPLPAPPGMSLPPAMNEINPLPVPPGMSLPPAMNEINPLPAPPGMSLNMGEPPNLMFIKHKLEMMKSMLEKGGNNLVPEMRAKLESEVKSFSEKIDSMVGSSSSS